MCRKIFSNNNRWRIFLNVFIMCACVCTWLYIMHLSIIIILLNTMYPPYYLTPFTSTYIILCIAIFFFIIIVHTYHSMLILLILVPHAWSVRYRCGKHSIEIDARTVYIRIRNSIALVLRYVVPSYPASSSPLRQYM